MKKFVIFLSLFILILLIMLFVFGRDYRISGETSDYMAAIIDKHDLLEKAPPPRLLFVGGSNLPFGLDSKRIEDSIGLPVVNMGLHGGLGLRFIIEEIKLSAKPKDTIILSIEYFLGVKGDHRLQKNAADYFPVLNKIIKPDYFTDLRNFIYYGIKNNAKKNVARLLGFSMHEKREIEPDRVYSRLSFNVFGDAIGHLDMALPDRLKDKEIFGHKKWQGIGLLNRFAAYAKSNNIRLYFIYPQYPESEFIINKKAITKYASDLESELSIQILNNPEDCVFPDNFFFDTVYHLNSKGRELRTTLIIEILKKLNMR